MITVVIPTYNRPECIEYICVNCIQPYKGSLFRFEIHDSSDCDETKKIIFNLLARCPYANIKYVHYDSIISGDDKSIRAIGKVETKYFWLLGDGNVVDFNRVERFLMQNNYEKYDVLNIEDIHRRGILGQDKNIAFDRIYNYTNFVLYAQKYFSHLTYWGASIINTDFFRQNYSDGTLQKYQNKQIPWWIACLIFESCYKKAQVFLGTAYLSYIGYNPMKKDHGWANQKNYYIFTFNKFNMAIDLLPSIYSDVKTDIIYFFRKDALVCDSYLIRLRSTGVLQPWLLKKYKKEIKRIDGFYYKMVIISYIPVFIAKFIWKLKPIIKFLVKGVDCNTNVE